jgi:hypothetical protein
VAEQNELELGGGQIWMQENELKACCQSQMEMEWFGLVIMEISGWF